jgi:hypothetical protein
MHVLDNCTLYSRWQWHTVILSCGMHMSADSCLAQFILKLVHSLQIFSVKHGRSEICCTKKQNEIKAACIKYLTNHLLTNN